MSRYIAIFSSRPAHILTSAQSFSPRVETHASGAIIIEVPGKYEDQTLDQLLELTVTFGRIDFAAADTRTAAVLAAGARPGSRVPSGNEQSFLAPFPVQLLSLCDHVNGSDPTSKDFETRVLDTFFRWGIQTLGQLAKLPRSELISRLGEKGLQLQKLARGEDLTPFQPFREKPRFEETQELGWELDGLEPLAFVLSGLLERLCRALESRGVATDRLGIRLRLADQSFYKRSISLALPMRNPKTLLSLLRLKLQSDPPQSGILGVFVNAHPVRPQVFQHSLLEPDVPNPEKLSRTLARLTALFGEKDLGSPVILDTYRPDAIRLVPFKLQASHLTPQASPPQSQLALRRIRPPLQTDIRTDQIVACAGPWRSSGNWWEGSWGKERGAGSGGQGVGGRGQGAGGWSRDEWDVELVTGQICRIFWDPKEKKWYLEGIYD